MWDIEDSIRKYSTQASVEPVVQDEDPHSPREESTVSKHTSSFRLSHILYICDFSMGTYF